MSFPPVTSLIAHRGEMLLLDTVLRAVEDGAEVSARVDPAAWYADAAGDMPAWVGIELMAQAIGVWAGLQAWGKGEPPKRGFLLGTRSYACRCPVFANGARLVVRVREVFRETNGLAAFECTISVQEECLAEATLKVFEPTDFDAFMAQGNV